MPDGIEKEIEIFRNPEGHMTNLARPAANGDKIANSCGAVGKALSWTTVQGMFLGLKEHKQKIGGSSLTLGMTVWGFLAIRPASPNLSP